MPVAQPAGAQLQAAVDGYRRFVTSETKTLRELTIPFAAAISPTSPAGASWIRSSAATRKSGA